MTSKAERNRHYERKTAARAWLMFLGGALVAILLLLRWAGFEWRRDAVLPIPAQGLSTIPYFDTPEPAPDPAVGSNEAGSDEVASNAAVDLPAQPHRIELPQSTLRASVEIYLEEMQQIETRKRALLRALIQVSPELRRLVERPTPDSPAEVDLDRMAVARNSFDEKRDTAFPLKSLPADEWDRILITFARTDPPTGCHELHEAYAAHLKALRDLTLQRLDDPHSRSYSALEHSPDPQPDNATEHLRTSTRLADVSLTGICAQFGLPKAFDVTVDEQ